MRSWRVALAAAALAFASAPAAAQAPRASIDSASWLAGRWIGEGLGGTIEEVWSPAQGSQMVGHFALIRDDAPVFYELMLLDAPEAGLRLRVKHFHPTFVAWEDREGWHTFEPAASEPDLLRFNGLTLRRQGDELLITITLRDRATGTTTDHELRLRRAPL
jgi:hypothetical protein